MLGCHRSVISSDSRTNDPDFDGFDETFVSVFEAGSRSDLDQVIRDLELMEEECKKSIKFVLKSQNVKLYKRCY